METNRHYKEVVRIFFKYKYTDSALKHQILVTVDDYYILELKHENLGYANVSTLDLLTHLCEVYGQINP